MLDKKIVKIVASLFLSGLFLALKLVGGLPEGKKVSLRKTGVVDQVTVDVNNWAIEVTNLGSYAFNVATGNAGGEFPKGSNNFIIFAAGFYVAAVKDPTATDPDLRYSVSHFEFAGDFTPGPILNGAVTDPLSGQVVQPGVPFDQLLFDNQNAPDNRVFVIDKSRAGPDWDEWPVGDGAPATDDGTPLLVSDQDSWCVFNDVDLNNHEQEDTEIPGLGVQLELHTFAFKVGDLKNIVFGNITVINRTDADLDSAYLGLWFDPDVGVASNDLIGVDTVYEYQAGKVVDNLAFAYNHDNEDTPTGKQYCTGVDFFQGPIVDSPGDTANPTILTVEGWEKTDPDYEVGNPDMEDTRLPNKKIVGASAFTHYINTAGTPTDPNSDKERFYYVSGKDQDGTIKLASEGFVENDGETFVFPGDPVLGTGLLANTHSALTTGADIRMMFGTGPFQLKPGVPTNIIFGLVGGEAADRLSAITNMRDRDLVAQATFNAAFSSAEPPINPNTQVIPLDEKVVIRWDNVSEFAADDFGTPEKLNISGWIINDFQGYRVYRSLTGLSWEEIAEYDKKDGVTRIVTEGVGQDDQGNQYPIFEIVEVGTDNGLQYQHVDEDVTNGITYFYAVTAYDVQPFIPPVAAKDVGTLESSQDANLFTAVPNRPTADGDFFDANVGTVDHDGLATEAVVDVTVVAPAEVTGHNYRLEIFRIPATLPSDPNKSVSFVNKPDVMEEFLILEPNVDSLNLTNTLRPGDYAWRLYDVTDQEYVKFVKADDPYTFYDADGNEEFDFDDANFNNVPDEGEALMNGDLRFDEREFSLNFVALDADGNETGSTMAFEIIDGLMIRVLDPTPGIAGASLDVSNPDELWVRTVVTQNDDPIAQVDNDVAQSAGAGFFAEGEDPNGIMDAVDWFNSFYDESVNTGDYTLEEHLLAMSRNQRDVKGTSVQPFELRFSPEGGTGNAQWAFSYDGGNRIPPFIGKGLRVNDPFVVPFTAWDVSDPANPRQVNIVMLDAKDYWEFTVDQSPGIFVMNSDYQFDDVNFPPVAGASFGQGVFGGEAPLYATKESDETDRVSNYPVLGVADVMGIVYMGDNPNVAYDPNTGEAVTDSAIVDTYHVQISPVWDPEDFSTMPEGFSLSVDVITALSTSDEFSFTSNASTVKDQKAQKQALKAIKAVPNPYYGYSVYQSGQFDKQVKFINLPGECTIRVFTVSGELVKTILHNDRSDNNRQETRLNSNAVFDVANPLSDETQIIDPADVVDFGFTGVEVWDLTNFRGNFIASGMYIVHVDAPGIGEKILKMAVIMEREIIQGSVEQ